MDYLKLSFIHAYLNLANALNISKRTIETSKGLPMIINCGADVLVVPLTNIIDIKSIRPDYEEIKKLSKKYHNYGPIVFHQHEDNPYKISCRFFFPIIGPDEDIVSGISISAISCYMIKHNFIKYSPKIEIISEQGFMNNRHSVAKCIISLNENIIEDVLITGNNLTMFECNYIKRDN
jgi:PhzF family phenazine biosynthesis protein